MSAYYNIRRKELLIGKPPKPIPVNRLSQVRGGIGLGLITGLINTGLSVADNMLRNHSRFYENQRSANIRQHRTGLAKGGKRIRFDRKYYRSL